MSLEHSPSFQKFIASNDIKSLIRCDNLDYLGLSELDIKQDDINTFCDKSYNYKHDNKNDIQDNPNRIHSTWRTHSLQTRFETQIAHDMQFEAALLIFFVWKVFYK